MIDDPALLPHRELFRRPAYWLLMLLPIVGFAVLHAWLAQRGHPLARLLPFLGFAAGVTYGFGMTQHLRRRWGADARQERRAKSQEPDSES